MRHSGNYGHMISTEYDQAQIRVKAYVYDELDRFQTVANFVLKESDLHHWLDGIAAARQRQAENGQEPLPPWQ